MEACNATYRTKQSMGACNATYRTKREKMFICNFCRKIICGSGINRVKKHLAGRKGEVTPCTLVDPDDDIIISFCVN